jgi:hypothetical protein
MNIQKSEYMKEFEKIEERKKIREFEKQFNKSYLLTTRFNNDTFLEYRNYCERKNFTGCFYNTPTLVCKKIPLNTNLYILEMNNDINRIVGIGLVINDPFFQKYKVYTERNYNIYSYTGKYRIDRNSITEDEEIIMQIFDILCFKGQNHMKRGQGITSFSTKILYRCRNIMDLVKCVEEMFKKRFKK